MTKMKLRRLIYSRWLKMTKRCLQKRHRDYHRYGARGIGVHRTWLGTQGFERFLAYVVGLLPMSEGKPMIEMLLEEGSKKLTLDRIDNMRGYEPGNLRWALPVVQSGNQRRTVFVDGIPRSCAARLQGVDPRTAAYRQRKGYSGTDAVSLPIGGLTADARRRRDRMIVAMIGAQRLRVDERGFVLMRGDDGWYLPPLASTGQGRYLGVSITVPSEFAETQSADLAAGSGAYRSTFQHARVVALFHHPLPQDGRYYEVDHINMDTLDDRPSNLRWRAPDDHRSDAHRAREREAANAPDYAAPDLRDAALRAAVADEAAARKIPPTVHDDPLPENLSPTAAADHVATVRRDPDFPTSIWADPQYAALLPLVLAAAGNRAGKFGDGIVLECLPQVGDALQAVYVTALRGSSRVYFACPKCGRQSFAVRTEIRNRVRCPDTECESCNALDRANPNLAAALAADPSTGVKPHPSRVSRGSNRYCFFRCRVEGCPNVIRRKIKSLATGDELPVCEFHRKRGANFG